MSEQKILALSGRKQSGKNTTANFMLGVEMMAMGLIHEKFQINSKGQLYIYDIEGDKEYEGVFDPFRDTEEMRQFLHTSGLNSRIRFYSFADWLKTICIKVLGLTYEQCYGTDEQKNSLTNLLWENMPGVTTLKQPEDDTEKVKGRLGLYYEKLVRNGIIYHKPGRMSAREVLQYLGTEIFRKMYSNVWVDSTIKKIKEDKPNIAVIIDCRFPNEVFGTQESNGKVLRLTKNPAGDSDVHESETALDKDKFDWSKFDHVLDNAEMDIQKQNEAFVEILKDWKWY